MVDLSSRSGFVLTASAIRKATVFCPNCGNRLLELRFDTPRPVKQLEVCCPDCQTMLEAECMFAVTGDGQPEQRDTEEMKQCLTTYWNRRLKSGVSPTRIDGNFVTRPKNDSVPENVADYYPIDIRQSEHIESQTDMTNRFTSYANRFGWEWNPDIEY